MGGGDRVTEEESSRMQGKEDNIENSLLDMIGGATVEGVRMVGLFGRLLQVSAGERKLNKGKMDIL